MNKSKKMYTIANILLVGGIVLLIVGYFLQTILIPIQDIDIISAEKLLNLQKELALNYPLGRRLMCIGGIGLMISVLFHLRNKIRTK